VLRFSNNNRSYNQYSLGQQQILVEQMDATNAANFSIETQLEQLQMVFFKHNTGATSAITAEVRRTTAISKQKL
jgi:hypothetical protein